MRKYRRKKPLALCYQVIAPNGKKSYLLGTQHLYHSIPEIETLLQQKEITAVCIEEDGSQTRSLLPILVLDDRIANIAHENKIEVISLDDSSQEELRFYIKRLSKIAIVNFFIPEQCIAEIAQLTATTGPRGKLYLQQDLKELKNQRKDSFSLSLSEKTLEDRNKLWKQNIFEHLDKGNALIAVGEAHLNEDKGYVDILIHNKYKLKPYPITVVQDDEGMALLKVKMPCIPNCIPSEEESIQLEKDAYRFKLDLNHLIRAYHDKKLSPEEKKILNEYLTICLFNVSTPEKNITIVDIYLKRSIEFSNHSLLYYFSRNTHHLFPKSRKKRNEKIKEKIKEIFQIAPEEETITIIGQKRRMAFMICLFFPDIAKSLFSEFLDEKNEAAAKLFLLFGSSFDKTNEAQVKFFQENISSISDIKPFKPKKEKIVVPDKDVPDWLKKILSIAAEQEYHFLEDVDQKLFDSQLPKLTSTEIRKLIELFNRYKDLNVSKSAELMKGMQPYTSQWQMKIVVQKILLTLAQNPYQQKDALQALVHYYDNCINPTLDNYKRDLVYASIISHIFVSDEKVIQASRNAIDLSDMFPCSDKDKFADTIKKVYTSIERIGEFSKQDEISEDKSTLFTLSWMNFMRIKNETLAILAADVPTYYKSTIFGETFVDKRLIQFKKFIIDFFDKAERGDLISKKETASHTLTNAMS